VTTQNAPSPCRSESRFLDPDERQAGQERSHAVNVPIAHHAVDGELAAIGVPAGDRLSGGAGQVSWQQ